MEKGSTHIGPYRATRLWNEMITSFRNGMPTSRHRRYMKSYEDCFSATEALDWLHAQITINPNFGPSVTRAQTLQLLEKFQKARVFEDVRGTKHQESIAENGRLYKFIEASPTKASRTPLRATRTPLASRTALMNTGHPDLKPTQLDFEKETCTSKTNLPNCHLVANSKITDGEVDDVWKAQTLSSLQKLLQLNSLGEILDGDYVDAQNIIHNMTHVNKNGVVCNIKKDDQLPYWVLSAMRCLAHWPDKVEENLPDYPGFERDVFKVVKDYFEGLDEPLLTFSMYEVFTNVFVCAEGVGRPRQAPGSSLTNSTVPGGITSFASVENLMMDLTMNGMNSDDEEEENPYRASYLNKAYHPARSCDPRVNGVFPGLKRSNTQRNLNWERDSKYASTRSLVHQASEFERGNLERYPSTLSMPLQGDRLETYFGVDDSSPHTHLIPGSGSFETSRGLTRHRSATGLLPNKAFSSTVSVETHYGADESFFQNEHKCLSTNDVYRLAPYPENGLSKHQCSSKSSYSSIPGAPRFREADNDTYGYTVVLSTTPKSNQTRERHLSESSLQQHHNPYSYTSHIDSDHDYYKRGLSRHQNPPPYVPPPSYKSIYQETAVSIDSSHSSYETAPSRPATPETHKYLYRSQPPQYISQPNVYGSLQELFKRGKHDSRFTSRSNMSGSYRKAVDRDHNYSTPLGRSLFRSRSLRRSQSSPNIASPVSKSNIIECLRICCLLLPPHNRRKLHLLLRLMVKMAENQDLIIDDDDSTRELVLQTFTRCILRSSEEADFDEVLSIRLTRFLMENYADIMKIPEDLKTQINERIAYLRRSKIHLVWDTLPSTVTYCAQVSVEDYEKQKMTTSQLALNELLDDIVKDKTMNSKEKKRRLKQFQKSYPDIYSRRFPNPQNETSMFPPKPPRAKPALLSRPLAKLKSFRM